MTTWDHWDVKEKNIVQSDLLNILNLCAEEFDVPQSDLTEYDKGSLRTSEVRSVFFYLSRRQTNRSLQEVAEFANRHHTTIIRGIEKIENLITVDKELRRKVKKIEEQLLNQRI